MIVSLELSKLFGRIRCVDFFLLGVMFDVFFIVW